MARRISEVRAVVIAVATTLILTLALTPSAHANDTP